MDRGNVVNLPLEVWFYEVSWMVNKRIWILIIWAIISRSSSAQSPLATKNLLLNIYFRETFKFIYSEFWKGLVVHFCQRIFGIIDRKKTIFVMSILLEKYNNKIKYFTTERIKIWKLNKKKKKKKKLKGQVCSTNSPEYHPHNPHCSRHGHDSFVALIWWFHVCLKTP